jgi:TPR repeat protein
MIFVSGRAGGFIGAGRIPARSVSEPGLIHGLYRGPIAMNRTVKVAVAALMLAVGFAGSVAAGPFEFATAAYNKGDYATALRLLRPLAQQSNAQAKFHLGFMYAIGQGVPQD